MIKNLGRSTIVFDEPISILGYASVVGKKEKEGPLGKYFDKAYEIIDLEKKLGKNLSQDCRPMRYNLLLKKLIYCHKI